MSKTRKKWTLVKITKKKSDAKAGVWWMKHHGEITNYRIVKDKGLYNVWVRFK